MFPSAEAWRLREAARRAMRAGNFGRAFELAAQAQEVQRTGAGKTLPRIGQWLGGGAR
jgi:hypothetical protein